MIEDDKESLSKCKTVYFADSRALNQIAFEVIYEMRENGELPETLIRHITKLFTRDFIDMKWTFEKLSKEVAHILPRGLCYESVVSLYNKVKMLD